MKFVVVLPLVLVLSSAQAYFKRRETLPNPDSTAKDVANQIINYFKSALEAGNTQVLPSLFKDDFVFTGCKGRKYNKSTAVSLISRVPASSASFSLGFFASLVEYDALIYSVNVDGFGAKTLQLLFIALPDLDSPIGFALGSGINLDC